ncbi:MAG: hypothetical protein NC918_02720 [Candidatus Omnitrophica bacterium]|nr:hypothetical protein [Candidatus Omnitrophota bacterium]
MRISLGQDGKFLRAELLSKELDFAGGLNETESCADNQSPQCLNVYVDDYGRLIPRPLLTVVKNTNFYTKRAFSYTDINGEAICVLTDNIKVRYTKDMNNFNVIPNFAGDGDLMLTPQFATRFTSCVGRLYGTNGYDSVWYWDGGTKSYELNWFGIGNRPKYIITYQDRIFFLNTAMSPDYLFYSDVGGLTFNPTNFIVIPSQHSGEGTGLAVCQRGLIIFKSDSCWLLTGYSPETYMLTPISTTVGCINTDTIQEYFGYIVFLGHDGFYKTDGVNLFQYTNVIPKTLNNIAQTGNYKENIKTIKGTSFDSLKDTLYTSPNWGDYDAFIPTDENEPSTEYITKWHLYNTIKDATYIWNAGDGLDQWDSWTSTNKGWTISNLPGTQGEITTDFYPMEFNRFIPVKSHYSIIKAFLECQENNNETIFLFERVYMEAGGYDTDGGIPRIKGDYLFRKTFDQLGLTQPKYKYKRFKLVVELWSNINGNWKKTHSLKTKNAFFIANEDDYAFEIFYRLHPYYPSYGTPVFLKYFFGKGRFGDGQYYTQEILITQKRWGNINFGYYVWNNDYTVKVYMRFYNGTWSDWIQVENGHNLGEYDPYNNSQNRTTKVRIAVIIRIQNNISEYPFQMNNITFHWYSFPEGYGFVDNYMSSVIWKNRYLLLYTQLNDLYNDYVLVLDETQKIPRFFKWYIGSPVGPEHTFFVKFANNIYIFSKMGNLNTIKKITDEIVTGREDLLDAFYYTKEFDFENNGILKDFDSITIITKRNNKIIDDLKIEVWIDGKYNGDLDCWLRPTSEKYFSVKHTTLLKHSVNFINKHLESVMPENYGGAYTDGHQYAFWEKNIAPLGFGNKLQLRFFWGEIWEYSQSAPKYYVVYSPRSAFYYIENIAIEMFLNRDAFYEPDLNLYEGRL